MTSHRHPVACHCQSKRQGIFAWVGVSLSPPNPFSDRRGGCFVAEWQIQHQVQVYGQTSGVYLTSGEAACCGSAWLQSIRRSAHRLQSRQGLVLFFSFFFFFPKENLLSWAGGRKGLTKKQNFSQQLFFCSLAPITSGSRKPVLLDPTLTAKRAPSVPNPEADFSQMSGRLLNN